MLSKFFLIISLFAIVFNASSQNINHIHEGDKHYTNMDYKGALSSYFIALHDKDNRGNAELHFKIGRTYLHTENNELAISFLEKAYKIDPEVDADILFHLGMAYQSSYQFAKAKYVYEHYRKRVHKKRWTEIDHRIQECITSHALVNNPLDVIIENAGAMINSTYNDYAPIISADGKTMIFTSNRATDTIQAKLKRNFEHTFISKKENGDWTLPKMIGKNLNNATHDAATSLSADGKTLFMYHGVNKGDIYIAKSIGKGDWSDPTPLNSNINTPSRETYASVSSDGKRLFFTSTRPGGKGNLDIYMSELDANGDWGPAVNLGDEINTSGDEDSPYIHPDGVTLYFSSDGHPGMGSSDIFKTVFKDGKWQKPENLGYPVNSIAYDGFFSIDADKKVAYFASRRKYGVGEYDILKATYRTVFEAKPEPISREDKRPGQDNSPMITLQGKVVDIVSKVPVGATISLMDFQTQRHIVTIRANQTRGDYEFIIRQGGKYVITAEHNGYLFNSINLDIPVITQTQEIQTDFKMQKVDVGSKMVLQNIFFDVGKATIKAASVSELEKLRTLLLTNPDLKVQINGHTDNLGDPETNKSLSLKRALAVVNHLALNGIDFQRLSAKGFGAEKPVASNDDEKDGRELNRRTEIEIVEVK